MNKLTYINEALKRDKDKLINLKSKLMSDVERYKDYIQILAYQTEKLANEL